MRRRAFATPLTDDDRQDFESKVYICPMVPDRVDERNGCYGYNYQFLGNSRQTNGRWHNFPVRLSKIGNPSMMVVAGDAAGSAADFAPDQRLPYENNGRSEAALGNEAYTIDPPRLNPSGDIATAPYRNCMDARHGNKAAAMYGDGHVDTRSLRQFGYRFLADGRVPDSARGGPRDRRMKARSRGTTCSAVRAVTRRLGVCRSKLAGDGMNDPQSHRLIAMVCRRSANGSGRAAQPHADSVRCRSRSNPP